MLVQVHLVQRVQLAQRVQRVHLDLAEENLVHKVRPVLRVLRVLPVLPGEMEQVETFVLVLPQVIAQESYKSMLLEAKLEFIPVLRLNGDKKEVLYNHLGSKTLY